MIDRRMTPGGYETSAEAPAPLENRLLRARARGEISCDAAFEQLYREYARLVSAWLALRVEPGAVDDLAQDVWLIFHARFRRWEFGAERESPEARPVLSFLFRTSQLVARAHRRLAARRSTEPLEPQAEVVSGEKPERIQREVEAGRALTLARKVCREEELDVLLAKLAGMSARDIASALSVTEAVVDHRYRSALARLRKEMRIDLGRGKHG